MMNTDSYGFHYNGVGWRFYCAGGTGYFPGNVQAGYSDSRLKDEQRPVSRDEVFGVLSGIRARHFKWNQIAVDCGYEVQAGDEEIGLIAQHVKAKLSHAAVVNKAGAPVDDDGSFDYLTINYDKITPFTVEAVNIHEEDIAALKNEIAELKALVAALTKKA
jgi:hypothetical protein